MNESVQIEIRDLTKIYKLNKKQMQESHTKNPKKTAVDHLTLTARAGEIYGLLGPNRAGKTTTLRCIATIIKPTSGEIFVNGNEVQKHSEAVRKSIGFLTSDIKLDPQFSVDYLFDFFGELRGIAPAQIKRRKEELFTYFGISDFAHKKIKELSTGMKQKAAIAVSLVHDPEVVIFDEPTNGLDIITARGVTDYLRKLKEEGKLVIVSTHIMSEAEKLCDRIGIIIDGKKRAEGTLQELLDETRTQDLEDAFFQYFKSVKGKHRMRTIYKKELARIFKDKKMVFSVFLLPVLIMVGIMALVGNLTSRQMEDIENHESIVYMMNEPESFTAFLDASDLHMDVKSVETEAERDDVMSMLKEGDADLFIEFPENFDSLIQGYRQGDEVPQIKTYYNPSEDYSSSAYELISNQSLEAYRQVLLSQRVTDMNELQVFTVNSDNKDMVVQDDQKASGKALGMMLPYFITILLFAGAMGIGTDMIAGEKRERHDGEPSCDSGQEKIHCTRQSLCIDDDFRDLLGDLHRGDGSYIPEDTGRRQWS